MTTLRTSGHRRDRGDAWLVCDSCDDYTEHLFVEARRLGITNGHAATLASSFEEVYRCCGCGTRRRWGLNAGGDWQ